MSSEVLGRMPVAQAVGGEFVGTAVGKSSDLVWSRTGPSREPAEAGLAGAESLGDLHGAPGCLWVAAPGD